MKKGLKYIKIEGSLTSRGEYRTESDEHRPYESLTIVDNDGVEVHFAMLSISKRMDEKISFNLPMTFYILRYVKNNRLIGVLYALESEGNKIYYPNTSIPGLKSLAVQVRNRFHLYRVPVFAGAAIVCLGGILALIFGFLTHTITGESGLTLKASLCGFVVAGLYVYEPMICATREADITQMLSILEAEGFDIKNDVDKKVHSTLNSKY